MNSRRPGDELTEILHRIAQRVQQGDDQGAEAAYRTAIGCEAEAREDFLFQTDGRLEDEKRRFIELNNRLVRREFDGRRPARTLLLLPFCLQQRACPHQIAWRVENCRCCGRCPVGPLREVCGRYGIEVRVTLRSRFAPEFVREVDPELVLAVACEHELTAGILRVAPYRCYGILNTRPEGFCKNTKVTVEEVEAAARTFLGEPKRGPRRRKGGRRGPRQPS